MATREGLQLQFSDLGIQPKDDVLDKCCEICLLNNIDVEEFVETWMAFTLTHLDGAEPTVENILVMERKEFGQRDPVVTTPKQVSPLRIYNTPQNDMVIDGDDNYCATPKGNCSFKGIGLPSKSPRTLFSPASYSPDVGTPCSKYSERTNARQIVSSHGINISEVNWRANNKDCTPASVMLVLNNESSSSECSTLNLKNRLMKESLPEKVDIFNDHIERLSKLIVESYQLEEPSEFRHPNSEKFVTVGRIFSCDSRLQQSTVSLEASETFSLGATIELSLQQLIQPNETCSGLFPGQVVAVEGVNPIGDKIITNKIYSPFPLEYAPSPTIEGPLNFVVAAGPYTQTDNLLYQPLEDLVSYVKEHDPHVAIIIGPLVDSSHPMIVDGSLAETYEEFYDKLTTRIMDQLAGCQTQVVVVASARDACQCPVYPTIPTNTGKSIPRLITVPDPCLLNVNGVIIGVSATDILMHLSREEMALSTGDRLGRLSSHLLSQQNFYPLYPPAEDLPFDSALWEELCNMKFTPHILVLPSDLRYFIKNVGECVVVNPERLAKGKVGGYFARLHINGSKDVENWRLVNHISGQILKI